MNNICYDSRNNEYKFPFGAVKVGTTIDFKVKLNRKEPFQKVQLVVLKENSESRFFDLNWDKTLGDDDIYSVTFVPTERGLHFYYFCLQRQNKEYYIFDKGNGIGEITENKRNPFQLTVYDADYKTPDWFKGGVMYQILPDRFCKVGDFPNDGGTRRNYCREWGKGPLQTEESGYRSTDFFGGNIKGIISKLLYLQSLGVTVIYLNPIFYAGAYHRYNTIDYMKIDPLLGTEEDFKELCRKAKALGIRIILDGVFSHTGTDSIYFNKDKLFAEPGAYNSKESKYYSWYDFKNYPDKYRCWWGIEDLPQINTDNNDFIEYINGENGVIAHWLSCGASGFRLDVADELTPEFIEALRSRVKKENSEAIVIGEVWEDASNKISYGSRRHYLDGEQLDSVMNYPWRNAVIDYIKSGDCRELSESVMTILDHYPKETVDSLFNLLGTHDTVRIISCLAGENSAGKGIEWKENTHINDWERDDALNLVKIAAGILYFLPGVPCIYYGDEAGFEGYEDPYNRRCFDWGNENKPLIEWYSTLGKLRKICPALKYGLYSEIISENGLFGFERSSGDEKIAVCVNMSNEERILDVKGTEILNFSGSRIENGKAILPPKTLIIFGEGSFLKKL